MKYNNVAKSAMPHRSSSIYDTLMVGLLRYAGLMVLHSYTLVILGQFQWGFIIVLWALIMLMWHHINEEEDDKSFMGVERVS